MYGFINGMDGFRLFSDNRLLSSHILYVIAYIHSCRCDGCASVDV